MIYKVRVVQVISSGKGNTLPNVSENCSSTPVVVGGDNLAYGDDEGTAFDSGEATPLYLS